MKRLLLLSIFILSVFTIVANTEVRPVSGQIACGEENFLDVQPDPANSAYPDPEVTASCSSTTMTVQSNGIPNYEFVAVTPGGLNEQNNSYSIPLTPSGTKEDIPLLGDAGVLVNGIPVFGPNEGGNLGFGDPVLDNILDFCNGHVGPSGYHNHAPPECIFPNYENNVGLVVGYSLDGWPILAPFECADASCSSIIELDSSWQLTDANVTAAWDKHSFVEGSGDLDECNGKAQPDGSYAYYATATFPYFMGCFINADFEVTNPIVYTDSVYLPIIINGTTTTEPTEEGLDTSLFLSGALAEDVTTQDCTLADGTETTCYEITIAGYPSNHDIGPFCPTTTSDTAEAGGIWFDGNGVYDLDGDFILGLATLYSDTSWKLYEDNGTVKVTDTLEAFEAAARPNVDPMYQNHCVEGRIEWLANGEPVQSTVLIPTTPVIGASSTATSGNIGITLNGVIIAPSAPVDAILRAYTIAAFDDCGGHINPTEGYHLHGARGCSEVGAAADGETPIFGYALDGYPIHSPLDSADVAAAGLDACQGHTTEAAGYHYHAASVEQNSILNCYTGVPVQSTATGPGPAARGVIETKQISTSDEAASTPSSTTVEINNAHTHGDDHGHSHHACYPDLAATAETLQINEAQLKAAMDAHDIDAAATDLGISAETLRSALDSSCS